MHEQIRQLGRNNNGRLTVHTREWHDWAPGYRRGSAVVNPEYVTLITEKTLRVNRAIREMNLQVVSPEAEGRWRSSDHWLSFTPYVFNPEPRFAGLGEARHIQRPEMVMDLWSREWPLMDDEKHGTLWQRRLLLLH